MQLITLLLMPLLTKMPVFTDNLHIMICALGKLNEKGDFLYYYIHDYQGSLFGEFCLTVIWGKNQGIGRQKSYTLANHAEYQRKIRLLIEKKIRSGYSVFYTYPDLKALLDMRVGKRNAETDAYHERAMKNGPRKDETA